MIELNTFELIIGSACLAFFIIVVCCFILGFGYLGLLLIAEYELTGPSLVFMLLFCMLWGMSYYALKRENERPEREVREANKKGLPPMGGSKK